jgi:hypothetical protein
MPPPLPCFDGLPAEEQADLQSCLDPGERVRWVGRPFGLRSVMPYIRFLLILFAFGVLWTSINGVAIALILRDEGHKDRLKAYLMIPVFLPVGLAFLSAPLWGIRQWKRTYYLLTDRRAAVVHHVGERRWRIQLSFRPDECRRVACMERTDGSGDLIFRLYPRVVPKERCGFVDVKDVREVEAIVRSIFGVDR